MKNYKFIFERKKKENLKDIINYEKVLKKISEKSHINSYYVNVF